jgi:hypothetical protein
MKIFEVIHDRGREACAGELSLAPTDLDLCNAALGRQDGGRVSIFGAAPEKWQPRIATTFLSFAIMVQMPAAHCPLPTDINPGVCFALLEFRSHTIPVQFG